MVGHLNLFFYRLCKCSIAPQGTCISFKLRKEGIFHFSKSHVRSGWPRELSLYFFASDGPGPSVETEPSGKQDCTQIVQGLPWLLCWGSGCSDSILKAVGAGFCRSPVARGRDWLGGDGDPSKELRTAWKQLSGTGHLGPWGLHCQGEHPNVAWHVRPLDLDPTDSAPNTKFLPLLKWSSP